MIRQLFPQLVLQLEAHLVDFSSLIWESVVRLYSPHGARWQGSASCCWPLVYYCFFAFYTPGSPPSSGAHWSVKQSKLQSSLSLTASFRPKQERLQQRFSKSETTPESTVFTPLHSHCGVEDVDLQEPQLKEFLLSHKIC